MRRPGDWLRLQQGAISITSKSCFKSEMDEAPPVDAGEAPERIRNAKDS